MSRRSGSVENTVEVTGGLRRHTRGDEKARCRVLVPFFTPFLYGMERAVIEIFDALRPGVRPHFVQSYMITQRRPPIIEEMSRRGFEMSLLPDKKDWVKIGRPRSLRQLCAMLLELTRGNIAVLKAARGKDVLYVPGISYAHFCILAALRLRLLGRRVVHHFHDLGTRTLSFPLWIWLVTDFVHNTQFSYEVVTRALPGIKRKRNIVVPYIIDLERPTVEDQVADSPLLLGRNIFSVGQVSRHKGIDLLLEAFKPIAETFPDVTLHLVGACAPDFKQELEQAISKPPLAGRVKCWGFREDSLRLLRSAYLHVHPSPPSRFHESFGRSVVEAMALGVPTVCFRSGALREIVVHEKTGLICDEIPSSLGTAMDRFLSDVDFRNDCGRNARQRYEERYSSQVVRQIWAEFFLPPATPFISKTETTPDR